MPPASLTRSVQLGMQPSEQQRRTRTGPNNSGRNVIGFLAHHDIALTAAQSRHQWHTLEDTWLRFNGVLVRESACIVFAIPSDDHLWTRKCLQGSLLWPSIISMQSGWFIPMLHGTSHSHGLAESIIHCLLFARPSCWHHGRELASFWHHPRSGSVVSRRTPRSGHQVMSETPMSFQPFHLSNILTEVSPVPPAWAGEMKSLAEVLAD